MDQSIKKHFAITRRKHNAFVPGNRGLRGLSQYPQTLGSYRDCPGRRGRIEPGYSGRGSFDRIV